MNKKKKIILFLGLGFLIAVLVCFVVVTVNKQERNDEEKTIAETKDFAKEDPNRVLIVRNKGENKKTNSEKKYKFKDPCFVSIKYKYEKTNMKADATEEEIFNNETDMAHVINFYVLLTDAFEEEGFFNKFNKDLFLDKCILWNDGFIRLRAETEFLIDGKENLERFEKIVKNKNFGDVYITKEKLDKATNEIFLYLKKHWGLLGAKIKELTKILKLMNKEQVNKAIEYYSKKLTELKEQKESGYIYTNGDRTQEVFLEKEIESLNTQDKLTEEQIKDFEKEFENTQKTFDVVNYFVGRNRPKNIKYESVKDLHKGIEVEKTVKDMKDEIKYYGMGK